MIGRLFQAIQTVTLIFAMIGGIYVTYQGYQLYSAISNRMKQIDGWIDRFTDRERRWSRFESRIESLELAELKRSEKRESSGAPKVPMTPTVILYKLDGCGPCEQWWREHSDAWRNAGWVVKSETSKTSQSTPYWDVWDGEKWMRFDRTLTLESYRKANGR